MPRGVSTDPEISEFVITTHKRTNWSAGRIRGELLEEERFNGRSIPAERTILDLIKRYQQEDPGRYDSEERVLDELWSIGGMMRSQAFHDLPWREHLSFLIKAQIYAHGIGKADVFTLRVARWMLILGSFYELLREELKTHEPFEKTFVLATYYSNRELSSKLGAVPTDTRDLDQLLAYMPWEHPRKNDAYRKAIEEGIVQQVSWDQTWEPPADPGDPLHPESMKQSPQAEWEEAREFEQIVRTSLAEVRKRKGQAQDEKKKRP